MRKIVVFNLISIDGFFAGEDDNIDWHMVDDEFNKFAVEHTKEFGAIIFGKTTYKLFEDFWPPFAKASHFAEASRDKSRGKPHELSDDEKIAQIIDDVEKIVFSKSLTGVTWKNTKLFHDIDPEEVRKWTHSASFGNAQDKSSGQAGSGSNEKPMVIFGSGTIVQQFANLGLIDEYRLLVNPVILGKGKSMFAGVEMQKLKLINTRTFGNGNVLLTYLPAGRQANR